ncbi:MAG: flagellar basal body rod C-terminal domain-containing protein, partial [Paracoccaceae bacterium]
RDLVERFADPAVDATLGATDPGLFTDDGAAFSSVDEVGLSARLKINALVDPDAGGGLWRLRDGLGAAVPGSVGDATLLLSLADALSVARVPASGGFIGAARSAIGLASDLVSLVNADLNSFEADQSFALAQVDTLTAIELRSGVDTDYEMQQLLLIEQAFAANARVITTVDEMIKTLLGL